MDYLREEFKNYWLLIIDDPFTITFDQEKTLYAREGQSALNIASWGGRVQIVKLLLDKGADLTAKDSDGCTALHLATDTGCVEVVKLLLDKGAGVTAKDRYGCTALHFASKKGGVEVVKLLLDKGADLTAKDWYGCTALHFATESNQSLLASKKNSTENLNSSPVDDKSNNAFP